MVDPRVRSLNPFVPHPFAVAQKALPPGLDEAIYDNIKKRYARMEKVAVERLEYTVDGLRVTGVFAHPTTIENGKHPILIFNRGGNGEFGMLMLAPIMRYMVPFAEQGYLVFGSNYRGNDGGEGADELGGRDINDVLELIDIAQQHPGWDGKNIFMLGGSRGGMMTYLAIKHGAPLNAAVSFAGLADLQASVRERPEMLKVHQRRIPNYETERDAADNARSAVQWPEALTCVPLLMLHGTADDRVDISHSRHLMDKLRPIHPDVKLVEYEGGNHSLSTHTQAAIEEISRWFTAHRR